MSLTAEPGWLAADWPAPANVHAGTTLRHPGPGQAPYDGFNLGLHVGDEPSTVLANRLQLKQALNLPAEPCWLEQVHSSVVVEASQIQALPRADASFTQQPGQVCVVMTADCLPVLFCNRGGTLVAAAHAGWRGLANGILEETFRSAGFQAEDTLVWLGPGIGARAYEVGAEVRQTFLSQAMHNEQAFTECGDSKYLMDMYCLARQRLAAIGVTDLYGGEHCTYLESERFFSYRRDGQTGRMASLIWLDLPT